MPILTEPNTTFYDYVVDFNNTCLVSWKSLKKAYNFKQISFEEIVVPTEDSMKMMEISLKLMQSN